MYTNAAAQPPTVQNMRVEGNALDPRQHHDHGCKVKIRELVRCCSILCLIVSLFHPGQCEAGFQQEIKSIRKFNRHNLGLMDISLDGRLLLMHEHLSEKSKATGNGLDRLRLLDTANLREIATIKFEAGRHRAMFFIPGSHEVLFSGALDGMPEQRYIVWDPHSGKTRNIQKVTPSNFGFIQFLDSSRILVMDLKLLSTPTYSTYDLSTDTVEPWDIKEIERSSWSGERTFILSPDHKTIVARDKNVLSFREPGQAAPKQKLEIPVGNIQRFSYSPDGKHFVAISVSRSYPFEVEEGYLFVYETETLKLIAERQVAIDEKRKGARLLHVGYQLGISPDGRWLVIGYDRLTTRLRLFDYSQARYEVYELPSAKYVGTVEHPPVRLSRDWASVSPVQGGRLRFQPDGRSFYTTSRFTIEWELPKLSAARHQ